MNGYEINLKLDCSESLPVLLARCNAFILEIAKFLPNFRDETNKFFFRNHKLIDCINILLNLLAEDVSHIYTPRSRHKDIKEIYLPSIKNCIESLFVSYHIKVDFISELKPNSLTLIVYLKQET